MILLGGTELHTGKRQLTTFNISGKQTDFTVYRYVGYISGAIAEYLCRLHYDPQARIISVWDGFESSHSC